MAEQLFKSIAIQRNMVLRGEPFLVGSHVNPVFVAPNKELDDLRKEVEELKKQIKALMDAPKPVPPAVVAPAPVVAPKPVVVTTPKPVAKPVVNAPAAPTANMP